MSSLFKILQRTAGGLSGLGEFAPAIVGNVDEGAIIERGSNANGDYVKFADGTMFLSGIYNLVSASEAEKIPITNSNGNHYYSDTIEITLPYALSNTSNVCASLGMNPDWSSTQSFWLYGGIANTQTLKVRLFSSKSIVLTQIHLQWFCKGRWK